MPKALEHILLWEEEHQHYHLHIHGQAEQYFHREDEAAFSRWLAEHSSFAFVGQAGRISVLKEARGGGTGYWYAYRTQNRRTHKRYLGSSSQVTLARLEQEARMLNQEPAPSSEQKAGVLSAKLSAPRLPHALVPRSRLLKELDTLSSYRLTLLSAPAGSGKTTLLSAWAAASQRVTSQGRAQGSAPAVSWLSLDELDNDPIRFWSSVISALRTCLPRIGEEALAMLHSRQSPPLSIILMTLLNELLEADTHTVLILDDYQVIEDQAIDESIAFLIEHLPDHLHLVLATRTDPQLPLARFRVRSQLLELRVDDLRFTRKEAASFLTEVMSLPLSEDDVTTLQERTEGWIAGLQLAALSMRKQEHLSAWVKGFAGSHRYLLDYVQQEILVRLPIRLQHFLLQTSILTRMNASLCQAVTASTGELSNQEMLQELEQANLFVVPLDEQRQWYRFHHLFRDVLLARLQTSHPEMLPLLHQRAASWYEAQGYIYDAMFHAQATADGSFAASLLERVAEEMWLQGEAQMVFTWVKALPDAVIREHWDLVQTAVHHLMISTYQGSKQQQARALEEMQQMIVRLEHLFWDKGAAPLSPAEEERLHNRTNLGRLWGATSQALAAREMKRLRPLGQEMWPLAQGDDVIWQMMPLFNDYIDGMYFLVDMSSLISTLQEVNRQAEREQKRYEFFRTRQWLAQAYCESGSLRLAHTVCQEALHLLEQEGNRQNSSTEGYLRLTLARLYGAWNRQEEAFTQLQEVLQYARRWHAGALLVEGCSFWTMLALETGHLTDAQQALEEMEQFQHQTGFANTPSNLEGGQVRLWLAQGNLGEAAAWANSPRPLAPEALESVTAWEEALMVARVYLALERSTQALEVLSPLLVSAQRGKRLWNQLRVLALQVVALQQSGRREQAREVAANLVAMSEAEGYIRVYLDAGPLMKEALMTLRETPLDPPASESSRSFLSRLLAAFEQEEEEQRAGGAGASLARRAEGPTQTQELVEPLSPQELRVLSLLVAGQTYAEMAQALIVSPNTIKTQVSSIYRKLGVSRRAQAIEAAAHLHLLSSESPDSFGD